MNSIDALMRPRRVAVIGASATRTAVGNIALKNLASAAFPGEVIPIHPEAPAVEGFSTIRSIDALPGETDVLIVAVPAARVADTMRQAEAARVRAAIVMSNGFTPAEDIELRQLARRSGVLMHGPNCMGLINVSDSIPLYTGMSNGRVRRGSVAVLVQSGSVTVALMNSTDLGFSKIVTIGSGYRLSGADYLNWLADDPETTTIGLVLESLGDPDAFADAADRIHAAGKALVVLKAGDSSTGAVAASAHTGALVTSRDAVRAFFERHGVPTVEDYDELIASLEAFSHTRWRGMRGPVAVLSTSGGEAVLTCDLAETVGVPLAAFAPDTMTRLKALLPSAAGQSPIDLGATTVEPRKRPYLDTISAIAEDPGVGGVLVVQDAQFSLSQRTVENYTPLFKAVADVGRASDKPVMMSSPTGESLHPELRVPSADAPVPIVRGLRPSLIALRNMRTWAERRADPRRLGTRVLGPDLAALRTEVKQADPGLLPAALVHRLLQSYGLPTARSTTVRTRAEALVAARNLTYPLVAKILSPDIPHRSEIGAVQLGIADAEALAAAIDTIDANIRARRPGAVIEGYELQEALTGCVEAVVGFQASPPFGALVVVGKGGVLVELENDAAVSLAPVAPAEALAMLGRTRLGAMLGGYRKLLPETDLQPLAAVVAGLSELAADLSDLIAECDLNPVMVRPGSGEARLVDALFVRAPF